MVCQRNVPSFWKLKFWAPCLQLVGWLFVLSAPDVGEKKTVKNIAKKQSKILQWALSNSQWAFDKIGAGMYPFVTRHSSRVDSTTALSYLHLVPHFSTYASWFFTLMVYPALVVASLPMPTLTTKMCMRAAWRQFRWACFHTLLFVLTTVLVGVMLACVECFIRACLIFCSTRGMYIVLVLNFCVLYLTIVLR